jgi:hypothetical protein
MNDYTLVVLADGDPMEDGEPISWSEFKKLNDSWAEKSFAQIVEGLEATGRFEARSSVGLWALHFTRCEHCDEEKETTCYTGGMMGSYLCEDCWDFEADDWRREDDEEKE